MRRGRSARALGAALALLALQATAAPPGKPLLVEGGALSFEEILSVARGRTPVAVAPAARERVAASFQAILAAARARMPVYGLTTGVGWNKDKAVLGPHGGLDPELLAASHRFNLTTLRAHGAGVGEPFADEVVRAALLIRLNLLLTGASGAEPAVVDAYAAFLNCDLNPLVPSKGSIGEADILQSAHIGLVMAGEWQARVKGEVLPGAQALARCGLKPVALLGKDFLAILADNSLSTAQGVLTIADAAHWLTTEVTVFALSLEGLNGNVAPFLPVTVAMKPEPGFTVVAEALRDELAGSDLWRPAEQRALQDPLSFRTRPLVLGNAWEAIEAAQAALLFAAAHPADNPLVSLSPGAVADAPDTQAARYIVPDMHGIAIVPTANFESLATVAAIERAQLALAHVGESMTASMLRFENPAITQLPRFLTAPGNDGQGFGSIQKAPAALDVEIRALALPVSLEQETLSGNIEDITNNGPLTLARLKQEVEDLYLLQSFELLHATQAVDLREGFKLGAATKALHDAYRAKVPFVDKDRILTGDIAVGARLLHDWPVSSSTLKGAP